MKIFDTHTHLNDEAYQGSVPEQLALADDLEVTKMAIVGSDEAFNEKSISLANNNADLYSIIGFHPETATTFTPEKLATLKEQIIEQPKVIAVGEIGLDYHFDQEHKAEQKQMFIDQLKLAEELSLPVSIHTRDATEDTYNILKEYLPSKKGIIHSFSMDSTWMTKFLELGMNISFSGMVTFKNAPLVQEAAREVPLDRLLVETDAPYLTPVPYRGKLNSPAYTYYVLKFISSLRDIPMEELAEQVYQNSLNFFGLSDEA